MGLWGAFYPIFRRNSTFALFIVTGGLVFERAFNKSTRYVFEDVMNKGKGYKYLEPKILQMQAAAADEE